eukprot:4548658-Prymnesium_polylepis.2
MLEPASSRARASVSFAPPLDACVQRPAPSYVQAPVARVIFVHALHVHVHTMCTDPHEPSVPRALCPSMSPHRCMSRSPSMSRWCCTLVRYLH